MARGDGLTIPMADWNDPTPSSALSHFPPGFPIAIATGVKLGMSAVQSARVIEAVAFGVTVAIVTYIVGSTVGTLAGLLIAIALLLARPIVYVHLSVLSEPLFLCVLALTLLGMLRRWHPLAVGMSGAAAALVRYAGVAVVGAVVLWELIEPGPIRRRITRALLAGLPTLVLHGAWVVHTRVTSGETGIRRFGFYGNLNEALAEGARTIAAWLVPTTDPPVAVQLWIAAAAALFLALVTSAGARQSIRSRDESRRVLGACALMICCYVGVLIVSRLTADANIPFDERILAPFILLVMIGVSVAVGRAWRGLGLLLRGTLALSFGAWLVASSLAVYDDVSWATTYGSDFAGEDWRTSELLRWVRAHGDSTSLYSNWPAAIYFHSRKPAWLLPDTRDIALLRTFGDTLARRGAVVVAFDTFSPDCVPPDSVAAIAGLRAIARFADGTVYGPPLRITER
ncbi:MAG TPA: hypothetical protein VKP00_09815 [Gemmatimonadaceae bacterium]|nr:hypothetical protein [Gemmatimonadaceae bacterium]